MDLLLLALGLLLGSGALALLTLSRPRLSTALGVLGAAAGCAVGLVAAVRGLTAIPEAAIRLTWKAPAGELLLGLDPLSAMFLVPLFGLSLLAAVYGREYLLAYKDRWLGPPTAWFNLLVAAMGLVLLARHAVIFLVGWELLSLSSFLLIGFDHGKGEVRRAAWIYLLAAHAAVLCLLAMFLLLGDHAGGLSFEAFARVPAGAGLSAALLALAFVGFGVKAGLVPFHVWLPEAHAAAPSHVSALMSGVIIKLGLYGLLRLTTFLTPASWWGPTLAAIGFIGAMLGISLALYQRDIKRVLAYSSVENVGIITLGLGIAFWGRSQGSAAMMAAGAFGALLHMWNHAAMKGLMFLSAGSVLHGSGTRDMEKLGGLLKRMPWTGPAMMIGAVAIAGLPPLNGFLSEFLLYRGLIGGGLEMGRAAGIAAFLQVGVLALVGGLASLCFVRLIGAVFLGEPRSEASKHAHESSFWMSAPIVALAAISLGLAAFPERALAGLAQPAAQLFGPGLAASAATAGEWLAPLARTNAALVVGLLLLGAVLRWLTRKPEAPVETWGCGYLKPTARMQYTGRSFSELMVGRLLPSALGPRLRRKPPAALFPAQASFEADCADPLTRGVYLPFFQRWADRFSRLRWLQQGALNIYLLYILIVAVAGLAWLSFFSPGSAEGLWGHVQP